MKIYYFGNAIYEGFKPDALPDEEVRDSLIDGLWWKTRRLIDETIRNYGYMDLADLNDSAVNANYPKSERDRAKKIQKWIKALWDAEGEIENQIKQMSDDELEQFDTTEAMKAFPQPPELPEE